MAAAAARHAEGTGVAVHWFRKGLRLHDNPALLRALVPSDGGVPAHTSHGQSSAAEGASRGHVLYPVFILDPWFAKPERVCANRYAFLLDCLRDLDASLRARGSRLFVLRGAAAHVLPDFLTRVRATMLTFERDTEPYARVRDDAIAKACAERGISCVSVHGHTLYEPELLLARSPKGFVHAYSSFQTLVSRLPPPPAPLPAPDGEATRVGAADSGSLRIPPLSRCMPLPEAEVAIPTLEEMGYDPAAVTTPFRGGETEALARMQRHLARTDYIATFEKPNTSPNALSPSTTVLSPYLKFGALSCRSFYWGLQDVYKRVKTHSQPPVSLMGQLLWREFFYASAFCTPNFDRMVGNPICTQIAWRHDPALVAAWEVGRTGYPWIDAAMAQLRTEGWMHHLARHAVACFLTRGDLYQSWEHGAKVFDRLLLDSDWAINNGNWMWLSASSYFYQFFRVYSPVAFPKKTDPNGDYIRKYLPQFASFPREYIYEPWKAPRGVQEVRPAASRGVHIASCIASWPRGVQAHGIIVGVTYPSRIVVHEDASKDNISAHARAYAAKKAGTPVSPELVISVGCTQVGSDPSDATRSLQALHDMGVTPTGAAPTLASSPTAAPSTGRSAAAATAAASAASAGASTAGKRARKGTLDAFLGSQPAPAAAVDLTDDTPTENTEETSPSTPASAAAGRKRARARE